MNKILIRLTSKELDVRLFIHTLFKRETSTTSNINFATLPIVRRRGSLQQSFIESRTMKLVVFLLLVASCQLIRADSVRDGQTDLVLDYIVRGIGDRFKAALEEFRNIMKTGNITLGIPVLDPLNLEHQKININEEQVSANGEVNNLHIEGLSDYVVQHADFKISKWNVSIAMLWSNIKGKSLYEVDGYIANKIPVYGAGDVSFDVSGFRFATQAKLKVNLKTKKVQIVGFNATEISVNKAKVDITGLYNNEDFSQLVSAVISDIIPETIEDFQEEITDQVNKVALKIGNQVLDQYTLDDIMKLIS